MLHVVDGLEVGGAQSVVRAMLALADETRFAQHVVNVGTRFDEELVGILRRLAPVELLDPRGLWDLRALVRLVRLVRRERIDVVHTHLAGADVQGGLAGRLAGRPVVATLHSVAEWRLSYRRERRVLADAALRFAVGHALAVSAAVRDSHLAALRLRPERVEVLENVPAAPLFLPADYDRAAARARLRADGPIVCTASRLTPERDHATLLRALPAVLARHPAVSLIVLGDGPERESLAALAVELGVAERVRFEGTRLDAVELMAAGDVFCQPTLLEGLPVALLDAMALGLPVVASRVPGVEGVVEDGITGVLVPPRDADAMAAALSDVLADRVRAAALAERARMHVERAYDARRWIRRVEHVWTEAAERRASAAARRR